MMLIFISLHNSFDKLVLPVRSGHRTFSTNRKMRCGLLLCSGTLFPALLQIQGRKGDLRRACRCDSGWLARGVYSSRNIYSCVPYIKNSLSFLCLCGGGSCNFGHTVFNIRWPVYARHRAQRICRTACDIHAQRKHQTSCQRRRKTLYSEKIAQTYTLFMKPFSGLLFFAETRTKNFFNTAVCFRRTQFFLS